MQLFYAPDFDASRETYVFSEDESKHMVRVLRLKTGDVLHFTDGRGLLCEARITEASPKRCTVEVTGRTEDFERRPYYLAVGIAPTKNMDRTEWFAEKATEIGIDRITPLLTDHSERRHFKTERLERVVCSAMKQSLKAYMPVVDELTDFEDYITEPFEGVKLIAHCEPGRERRSIKELVKGGKAVKLLIGPEGDFSPEEIELAVRNGFREVSLGNSRLRTETAAVVGVHSVAFINE